MRKKKLYCNTVFVLQRMKLVNAWVVLQKGYIVLQYSGLARQVGYWRRRSRYNGLYRDSIVGLAGKEIISQYSILYCDLGAKGNGQGCIAIQPLHLRHGRALCLRHGMGAGRTGR